jgi:UDP-N-acetyl-D-mannosaminuronic acid dehydrogenase
VAGVNEADARRQSVAVIGLGYVGLTLAVALAQRGFTVVGVEKRPEVVSMTNAGTPHFSETGLAEALGELVSSGKLTACKELDPALEVGTYIITVGTPLAAGSLEPRLDMIQSATRSVAEHMRGGESVILRSTVKLGTARELVRPILAATGKPFLLSMCPERTLEGAALEELAILPQIVSGDSPEAVREVTWLFRQLTQTVVEVSSLETAEMIKLIDNTSRDVRFAFANEVARACDALGINAGEVIRAGKLGYPRTDVALPGLVGGPCLEKDPHILIASVAGRGIDLEITRAARQVNERQPAETVDAIIARLADRGPGPYRIAVAGIAFKGKPETDDLRGSMALRVIDELLTRPAVKEVVVYDGVVSGEHLAETGRNFEVVPDLVQACGGAHCLVIGNNHPQYRTINVTACVEAMAGKGFIYDYWSHLVERPPSELTGRYFTVGNHGGRF